MTVSKVCFQNVAISSVASLSMFVDQYRRDLAVRVALTYGGIEIIVLLIFCFVLWKVFFFNCCFAGDLFISSSS